MASPAGPTCPVCRRRFQAGPSCRDHQILCGAPACRRTRDNALARTRRQQVLDEARRDERERQQKHRQARREAKAAQDLAAAQARLAVALAGPPMTPMTPVTDPCHAPASADNPSESLMKSVDLLRRKLDLSHASLLRNFAEIQGVLARISAPGARHEPPLSRASLPAQSPGIQADSA
jgi:hypothetical protein